MKLEFDMSFFYGLNNSQISMNEIVVTRNPYLVIG